MPETILFLSNPRTLNNTIRYAIHYLIAVCMRNMQISCEKEPVLLSNAFINEPYIRS